MKEIFVVSSPRSGNAFLCRMLGDVLDSPLQAWQDTAEPEYFGEGRDGGYVIRKTHSTIEEADWNKDAKVIFLQRDPRDVIVSRLFYNSVLEPSDLMLIGMIGQMLTLPPRFVYENWVRAWHEHSRVNYCTTFGALKRQGNVELEAILRAIEVDINPERINEVVEDHSFEHMKAKYGDKYDGSMRKGITGDWREHFTRRSGEYMNDILGKFMLDMGFIDDLDWWKELR